MVEAVLADFLYLLFSELIFIVGAFFSLSLLHFFPSQSGNYQLRQLYAVHFICILAVFTNNIRKTFSSDESCIAFIHANSDSNNSMNIRARANYIQN